MSFGALSPNAIRALNSGAKKGGFAHDTGRGRLQRLSPRKRRRHRSGRSAPAISAAATATARSAPTNSPKARSTTGQDGRAQAQPGRQARPWRRAAGRQGHGRDRRGARRAGRRRLHLAGAAFGVRDADRDDAIHRQHARLSGGKPAGFKLCIGHPWEFLAICKAMLETGIYPDFIVIDGKEGGTGAAPLEFVDHLGMPLREGLNFVHNALIGINARDRIKLGAAGKIVSAFDIARAMALGADWCNAARGFMFALGCIQSQSLPHRPLPDRRRDPGPHPPARAGGRRQVRARLQFPPRHAGGARRAGRGGRPRPSDRIPPGAFFPARLARARS